MDIGDPVAATDTDNDTLTYSLDATSAESFDIDASSGQLQTKAALDHETRASYTVTVSVRDSKDENSDANEVTDDTIRVTILVADINEAPVFPTSETGMRSVDENTAAGVNIGAPVGADDDDSDTLTYSLDVTSRATFDIVATTGQLQTKAALDYETGSTSYSVTVTATDPSGADDTITVTITVNNVDEAGRSRCRRRSPSRESSSRRSDRPRQQCIQRQLDVGGFSEWEFLDPRPRYGWIYFIHLHAECRRCGPLTAGQGDLHRRLRIRQERPHGLRQ